MKRFIFTGLVLSVLLGSQISYAQAKHTFEDDIYSDKKAEPKTHVKTNPPASEQQVEPAVAQQSDAAPVYYSDNSSANKDYQNSTGFTTYSDTYFDRYETGDPAQNEENSYEYTTHINQFYHPWYAQPYWSTCYSPMMYDPYWGWSNMYYPYYPPYWSFGFSFGVGYYGGYGGFYMGFGYPYYPYYPYYGYGYGGCGYGYGGYGHGYPISYGPRYSMNSVRNNYAHGAVNGSQSTYRPAPDQMITAPASNTTQQAVSNPNAATAAAIRSERSGGQRVERPSSPVQSEVNNGSAPAFYDSRSQPAINPAQSGQNSNMDIRNDRMNSTMQSSSNAAFNELRARNESSNMQQVQPQSRRDRGSWFGGRNSEAPVRSYENAPSPRQNNVFNSQPRAEYNAPRMQSPSNNSFGGSRSFGGGGGGGSFGGGMRGGGGRR